MRRRVFTVGEANALLPHLREVLGRIQELRSLVGTHTDQLKILDVIWGRKVSKEENPDHEEFEEHRKVIGGAVGEIEQLIREEILALGVRFPPGGLEHGLLDFPTKLDGRWIYLCWRVEEEELGAWHEVDDGFMGRKPLTPQLSRRMGRTAPRKVRMTPTGVPEKEGRDGASFRRLIPGRREVRAVAGLALPVAAVQVGMMAMGVVDTVMVGHFSARDLAAVALGNLYFFTAVVFPMGVLMSLDPVVSQAVGAGDRVAIGRALQRGGVLALGLGIPAALALLPGTAFLTVLRQPPDVVPVAAGYAVAAMPGLFPFLAFIVLRQTLQAMGRVAPIVVTIVLANLANLLFNWILIFGNLGFPSMGAIGSGWASSLSRWLMFLGLLAFSWPLLGSHLMPFRRDALQLKALGRMIRLGAPIGIQFGLEFGAFGTIGIFMGWLGTLAMAGHQVAMNLSSFTFMVPLGFSQATAVLVGQAVGRNDSTGARRVAGAGILLGASFMTLTALLFLALPGLLARAYSGDGSVVAVAALLIPLAGVFQVFDGLQVVASGVLRGVGDTRSPMVVNLLGFWCLGMPVSLWLGFRTSAGPVGLWWGLVVGLAAVALFLLLRVRVRLGRDLRRIVIDDEE